MRKEGRAGRGRGGEGREGLEDNSLWLFHKSYNCQVSTTSSSNAPPSDTAIKLFIRKNPVLTI